MCGNSGSRADVGVLAAGNLADLVITSPPYETQRTYGGQMDNWLFMMRRVFAELPVKTDAQLLVNLGLVYRQGQCVPYWQPWLDFMGQSGWRLFGWYVWHKGPAMPKENQGRLGTSHEWVFHLNRVARPVNKTTRCKHAGKIPKAVSGNRHKNGSLLKYNGFGQAVSAYRVADSVFEITRETNNKTAHPAVFPVRLPQTLMEIFGRPGDIVFEPFAGSGSTMIAAENMQLRSYNMEIESKYCDIAMERMHSHVDKELRA